MTASGFAVIGGDLRQTKLIELLLADKHKVSAFALPPCAEEKGIVSQSLAQAVEGAHCVILPLPVSRDGIHLFTATGVAPLSLETVFSALSPQQKVLGGFLSAHVNTLAATQGVSLIDYYTHEPFVIAGALATAEGAISIAMEERTSLLSGSRALVLGFGRIAKLLAHKLKALDVTVSIAARRPSDIAWAKTLGYTALFLDELDDHLHDYHIIFNTIPHQILDFKRLAFLDPQTLLIDLASPPGGFDFSAAKNLDMKTIWALSIPGRYAPTSTAHALRDTVYQLLHETP